jgi:hypothetical protein
MHKTRKKMGIFQQTVVNLGVSTERSTKTSVVKSLQVAASEIYLGFKFEQAVSTC